MLPKHTISKLFSLSFPLAGLLLFFVHNKMTAQQIWTSQASGTSNTLSSVFFINANTGTAVGANGTILRTTDGGATWSSQTSGTSLYLTSVFFSDANNGWAVGQGTYSCCGGDQPPILRTTNGGTTWTEQTSDSSKPDSDYRDIAFIDANIGVIVGWRLNYEGNQEGLILQTGDGGSTWTWVTSGTTRVLRGVNMISATGTAVGDFGTILRTTTYGLTWTSQTSGTTNSLHDVYFTDADTGTAVGSGGTILRTTNGGTTWTSQTSGTTDELVSVDFTDANIGTVVGTAVGANDGTILHTTDGGSTWIRQSAGISSMSGVSFTDAYTGTAVGYSGAILRTTSTVESFTLASGNNQSSALTTVLINPFGVTVKDQNNNSAQGATITFAIATAPGGATGQLLSALTATTNSSGEASTYLTLGNAAGDYSVTASVTGLDPVTFTATATTWTSPRSPQYALSNGNSYVEIADDVALDLTSTYTIEAWIYPLSFNTLGGIVGKWHSEGNGYFLRLTSTFPYTGLGFDGLETANGILTAGQWYHVAVINNNGTRMLYVNGEEVAMTGSPVTVQANTDPVSIGADFLPNPRYFRGLIDEVRIWNTARSQSEIQENMRREMTGTESGLAGYWPMNEGSGTTANDGTSNNNDGTLNNASWAASSAALYDANKYEFSLDGDDYVEIDDDDALDLTTNYTIEAWMKPSSFNSLAGIVSKWNNAGNSYFLRLTTASPYTGIGFDGLETANGVLSVNQWYHIAAVNNGGTRTLYVNGEQVVLSGSAITVQSNSDPLTIGVDYLASPRYFNGKIDEVRIWNVARTAAEIRDHMHLQLTGVESGLAGAWQFNEGYLGFAYDATSNFNTGTLKSASWNSSTAPLGDGVSNTQTISSTGNGSFTGTDLSINFTAKTGTDDFVATIVNAAPGGTQPSGVTTLAPTYWVVEQYGSGTFTADLTFTLGTNAISAEDQATPANIKLFTRGSTEDGAWTLAASGSSATSSTATFGDITSFSQLAIGTSSTSPLPVQISFFSASASLLNAELKWRTETEVENVGWEIQRRNVGMMEQWNNTNSNTPRQKEVGQASFQYSNWSAVGFVEGAGTSSTPKDYSFVDRNVPPGRYAYRLKQIDNDGSFSYSMSVEVEVGLAPRIFSLNQNYPNPFNPSTTIEFTIPEDGHATLRVYDLIGREVATLVDGELTAGVYHKGVFDASRLASGTYVSQLKAGGKVMTRMMVLVK